MTTILGAVPVALGPRRGTSRTEAPATDHPEGFSARGPDLLPLDAGEHYRFGFSMDACIGCHSCEVACAEQNGLPPGTTWRRVGEIEGGEHPQTRRFNLSMACNHCLEPACLEGCPTNAYVKLDNGVVSHNADECIGCQYCTWGCPYSVPLFQPDRRIVTKCDMCLPRLEDGLAPACVGSCPTHAITIEKVVVAEWLADHAAADAPQLPSSDLTISTTRITLPRDVPVETFAASDWNLRPEHPHWPLVWLTMVSQLAMGTSVTATTGTHRLLAAAFAAAGMAGALLHLGRPAMAWKAFRNLRRSWLSREVLFLSMHAALAALAVVLPAAAPVAGVVGVAGVFASARLYVVPGRPAWDSPLTILRFFATALATGPLLTGHTPLAVAGAVAALAGLAANWARLQRDPRQAWRGAVSLELRWFRPWTVARLLLTMVGVGAALAGVAPVALLLVGGAELIGRWLFYVTVVPLNMPGSFWRGAAGTHR